MAYRRKKGKTTMGKPFTTKRGRYGCYKYVNGKRVGFVEYNKPVRSNEFERRYGKKSKYYR